MCFEEINIITAEKQSVPLALKCLGTNVVGTKVYRTAFSGSSRAEDFYVLIGFRPTVS